MPLIEKVELARDDLAWRCTLGKFAKDNGIWTFVAHVPRLRCITEFAVSVKKLNREARDTLPDEISEVESSHPRLHIVIAMNLLRKVRLMD
jgi:hypothetical protein